MDKTFDFQDLKKFQSGFAMGIRFRHNFSIQDSFGAIIEKLLYSKQTYFTPERFPQVLANQDERVLFNQITRNKLIINTSNIILDISDCDNISEQKAVKCFADFIVDKILLDYSVKGINRIGFVHKYELTDKDLFSTFRNTIIRHEQKSVNNINLQFTQKRPCPEVKSKKGESDYYNIIYSISDANTAERIQLSIDFQKIFSPPLETSQSIEFNKFISAESANNDVIIKFLNKNYGIGINAEE